MATSRESLAMKYHWRGNTYKEKTKRLLHLFRRVINSKYSRKLFIMDNFTVPYQKRVGCKYFHEHSLHKDYDSKGGWCTKCHKWFNDYESVARRQKLKKLIKKTK